MDYSRYYRKYFWLSSELEWKLSEFGSVKTDLEENPFKKREIRDVLSVAVRNTYRDADDSDEDSD